MYDNRIKTIVSKLRSLTKNFAAPSYPAPASQMLKQAGQTAQQQTKQQKTARLKTTQQAQVKSVRDALLAIQPKTPGGKIKLLAIMKVLENIEKLLDKDPYAMKIFFFHTDNEAKCYFVDFSNRNNIEVKEINEDNAEVLINESFFGFVLNPKFNTEESELLINIFRNEVFSKHGLNYLENNDFGFPCVTMLPFLRYIAGMMQNMKYNASEDEKKKAGMYMSYLSQYVGAMYTITPNATLERAFSSKKNKDNEDYDTFVISTSKVNLPDIPTVTRQHDLKIDSYTHRVFTQAIALLRGYPIEDKNDIFNKGIVLSKPELEVYRRYAKMVKPSLYIKNSDTTSRYFSNKEKYSLAYKYFSTQQQANTATNNLLLRKVIDEIMSALTGKWNAINKQFIDYQKRTNRVLGGKIFDIVNTALIKNLLEILKNKNSQQPQQQNQLDLLRDSFKIALGEVLTSLLNYMHVASILYMLYSIYNVKTKDNRISADTIDFVTLAYIQFGFHEKIKPADLMLMIIYEFLTAINTIKSNYQQEEKHFNEMLEKYFDKYKNNLSNHKHVVENGNNIDVFYYVTKDYFEQHVMNKVIGSIDDTILLLYKLNSANLIIPDSQKLIEESNKINNNILELLRLVFTKNPDVILKYLTNNPNGWVDSITKDKDIQDSYNQGWDNFISFLDKRLNENVNQSIVTVPVDISPIGLNEAIDEITLMMANNKKEVGLLYNFDPYAINACSVMFDRYIKERKEIKLIGPDSDKSFVIKTDKLLSIYEQKYPDKSDEEILESIDKELDKENVFNDLCASIKDYETVASSINSDGSIDTESISKNPPKAFNYLAETFSIVEPSPPNTLGQLITIDNIESPIGRKMAMMVIAKIIMHYYTNSKNHSKIFIFLPNEIINENEQDDNSSNAIEEIKAYVDALSRQYGQNSPKDLITYVKKPDTNSSSIQVDEKYMVVLASSSNFKVLNAVKSKGNNQKWVDGKKKIVMIYYVLPDREPAKEMVYLALAVTKNNVKTQSVQNNRNIHSFIITDTSTSYNINRMLAYRYVFVGNGFQLETDQNIDEEKKKALSRFEKIFNEKYMKEIDKVDKNKEAAFAKNRNSGTFYVLAEGLDQIIKSLNSQQDSNNVSVAEICEESLPAMAPEKIARAVYELMRDGIVLKNDNTEKTVKFVIEISSSLTPELTYFIRNTKNYSYIILGNKDEQEMINKKISNIFSNLEEEKKDIERHLSNLINENISISDMDVDIMEVLPGDIVSAIANKQNIANQQKNVTISEKELMNYMLTKADENSNRYLFGIIIALSELLGDNDQHTILEILGKEIESTEEFNDLQRISSYILSNKSRALNLKKSQSDKIKSILIAIIQGALDDPITILQNTYGIDGNITKNDISYIIEAAFRRIYERLRVILYHYYKHQIFSHLNRIVNIFLVKLACNIRSRSTGNYIKPKDLAHLRQHYFFDDPILAALAAMIMYGVLTNKISSKYLNDILSKVKIYDWDQVIPAGASNTNASNQSSENALETIVEAGLKLVSLIKEIQKNNNESPSLLAYSLLCLELAVNYFEVVANVMQITHLVLNQYLMEEFERMKEKEMDNNGFLIGSRIWEMFQYNYYERKDITKYIKKTEIKSDKTKPVELTKGVYKLAEYYGDNKMLEMIVQSYGIFTFDCFNNIAPPDSSFINYKAAGDIDVFIVSTLGYRGLPSFISSILFNSKDYSRFYSNNLRVLSIISPILATEIGVNPTIGYSDMVSEVDEKLSVMSGAKDKPKSWLGRIIDSARAKIDSLRKKKAQNTQTQPTSNNNSSKNQLGNSQPFLAII